MANSANIVVLGAGVTGLTTALLLGRTTNHRITVIAKHMPGDYDAEYASPWAGANFLPVSRRDTEPAEWDRVTFKELWRLVNEAPEAGIHKQEAVIFSRNKDASTITGGWFSELLSTNPWFKNIVPNFRILPRSTLPPGVDSGTAFQSVCINTAIYLPYLVSQCLRLGITFRRVVVSNISEAYDYHSSGQKADLVVNCTGLMACKLGGVQDANVIPARGQIVLVRNTAPKMYVISGTDEREDEVMYIMTRAAGGGTILGGSYQVSNWNKKVDPNLAVRIMKRCVEVCPELVKPGQGIEGLDVIRHSVGLRPLRICGPRLDKEVIIQNGQSLKVVHYYGVGGYGYQSSYGMAQKAVSLIQQALAPKAKL